MTASRRLWIFATAALAALAFSAEANGNEFEPLNDSELRATCSSVSDRYTECNVGVSISNPRVYRQISERRPDGMGDCVFGQTWGYRGTSFWVNYGCAAEFAFVPSTGPQPSPSPGPSPGPSPQPSPNPNPSTGFECRTHGSSFYPYDLDRKRPVGMAGPAYSSRAKCERAIQVGKDSKKNVMCGWNHVGISPYYLPTNIVVGLDDIAYVHGEDCNAVIANAANGMLCSFNDSAWVPYEIERTRPQTRDKVAGFHEFNTCVAEIRGSRNGAMCAWNGSSWQPYSRRRDRMIGMPNFGFQDLNYCRETITRSTTRHVCNWDGYGFRPYEQSTNYPVGRYTWSKLRDCYASVR